MKTQRITRNGQTFDYIKLDAYGGNGDTSAFHIEFVDAQGNEQKCQSIIGHERYLDRFDAIVHAGGTIKLVVCEKLDLGLRS